MSNSPNSRKNWNTKLPVESRNKICILNINFLRIGRGNEVNRRFPCKHRWLGYLHAANYCLSLRTLIARVNNWDYKLFTYLTSDLHTLASIEWLYPSYLQNIFKPFLILTIIIQIYVRTTLRQLPSWKISVPSLSSLHSLQKLLGPQSSSMFYLMLLTRKWSSCYTSNRTYICIVKSSGEFFHCFKAVCAGTDLGLRCVGVEKWALILYFGSSYVKVLFSWCHNFFFQLLVLIC